MIRLVDVHKAFGPKRVLEGFTLDVNEGETMVIIGYSGTGKSVAIKHIVGLLEPDQGTVWVDGLEVPTLTRPELYALRAKIGYVFQFAALFDSMNVFDNVAMGLRRMATMTDDQIAQRVAHSLQLVEMQDFADRMPSQLSGGQRKRVGLARAVATHPKYLLYDEPTTGLDPVTTAVIDGLIMKMRNELGVTSVVVTHDMKSAYRIADRIAMLDQGRIRYVGTPAQIQEADDPIVRAFIEGRPELAQEVAA